MPNFPRQIKNTSWHCLDICFLFPLLTWGVVSCWCQDVSHNIFLCSLYWLSQWNGPALRQAWLRCFSASQTCNEQCSINSPPPCSASWKWLATPGFVSWLMVQIWIIQLGDFPTQWLDGSLWLRPVRRQVTTNRNWVKMVKSQVRSVLFFTASRDRMRSDQFSVCIEFLLSGLKKGKAQEMWLCRGWDQRGAVKESSSMLSNSNTNTPISIPFMSSLELGVQGNPPMV